jgi:hypothetical protein
MSQFVDEEVYPVSESSKGYNAFSVTNCESAGHQPSYCICLMKIDAMRRDGNLRGLSCESDISNKTCIALNMREEEVTAGKAIYFLNRKKLNEFNNARDAKMVVKVTPSNKPRRAISPEAEARVASQFEHSQPIQPVIRKLEPAIESGSYADAINSAIAESLKPKEPALVKEQINTPPPSAGMSMRELARLSLAAKNQ